jgi:hypothetical protein
MKHPRFESRATRERAHAGVGPVHELSLLPGSSCRDHSQFALLDVM